MKRRMHRLLRGDGRILIVAMDHTGFMDATVEGLARYGETCRSVVPAGADAFLSPIGSIIAFGDAIGPAAAIASVDTNPPFLEVAVERALAVGADAVKSMLYPFAGDDSGQVDTAGRIPRQPAVPHCQREDPRQHPMHFPHRRRLPRCRQLGQPGLHVSVRDGCFQRHGFDDFDDADAILPCAAGRSKARKAFRKKSMSICWRPTSRSSSAMRALARASAERFSSTSSGLSLRGPGFGPRLRFNPSGP